MMVWWGVVAGAACADLKVIAPNALRNPVLEVSRAFVRGGHRVELIFASVGAIHKRIATGEKFDVAIGTAQGVDALIRLGRGAAGSDAPVARSVIGLALHKSRPAIDANDPQSLAALLRDAASIVLPDAAAGAPGGAQAMQLVQQLAGGADLESRIRAVADPREVAKRVAAGSADIGVAAMHDLVANDEVRVVGPILDPPTDGIVYAALVTRGSPQAEAGAAYVMHLRSAEAAAVFRRAGYATAP